MSMAEIAIIFLIALVFLGPEKLPELARFIGKTLRQVRQAGNMVREAFEFEEERERLRKFKREQEQRMREMAMAGTGPADQIDDDDDHDYWNHDDDLYHHSYDHEDYLEIAMREASMTSRVDGGELREIGLELMQDGALETGDMVEIPMHAQARQRATV